MFNRKRVKELEAKLEAYKELTDQYQQALESREQAVRRFDSGVIRVKASYTITESDVNKYNAAYMPRVARERMSGFIGRKIVKEFEPEVIYDEDGKATAFVYDVEVKMADSDEFRGIWEEIG